MSVWVGITAFAIFMLGWVLYENHKRDKENKE